MGYNRSGKKRTSRLKRHRREERRLAGKPAATKESKPVTAAKS